MAEIVSGLRRLTAKYAVTRGGNGQWRRPEAEIQTAKTAKGGSGTGEKSAKTHYVKPCLISALAGGA
jgi:hypothetical protein